MRRFALLALMTGCGLSPAPSLGVEDAGASVQDASIFQLTPNDSDHRVVEVGTGAGFTCARNAVGAVRCWGENGDGQLGTGDRKSRTVQTAQDVPLARKATALAVGEKHVCALDETGAVWCWGDNDEHEIDPATVLDHPSATGVVFGVRVMALAAGDGFTCAGLEGGEVVCRGKNDHAQLGVQATAPNDELRVVENVDHATILSAGSEHVCTRQDDVVLCWGSDGEGRLGGQPFAKQALAATALGLGAKHSCAVVDGAVVCWGGNADLQLGGNSTTQGFRVPAADGGRFVGVVAAGNHTCATQEKEGVRSLWCWGAEDSGSRFTAGAKPDRVSLGGRVPAQVATSRTHTCIATAAGAVTCWGAGAGLAPGKVGDLLPWQ